MLSPAEYNARTDLAIVCPVTNQVKGWPFEVVIPDGLAITGAVLADQLKTIDWKSRAAKPRGKCPRAVMKDVHAKIRALLQL